MNRYPTEQLTLSQTCLRALRLHYLTLRHVVLYVALIALTKNIAVFLMGLYTGNRYVEVIVQLVALILIVAFFAAALLATSRAFDDKATSVSQEWRPTLALLPKVYTALIIYVVGAAIMFFVGDFLVRVVERLVDDHSPVHGATSILGIALLFVYISMTFFLIPVAVTDNLSISQTFYKSISLSEKNKFGIFLLYFILLIIYVLLMPGTLHEAFMSHYHVTVLFDFVALSVMGPFFLNMLLLILNDSKLQWAEEQVEIEDMP